MTDIANSISAGKVTFEDVKKHDGYTDPQFAPSKRVAVELHFSVPEGNDGIAFLNSVMEIAEHKVDEMLGRAAKPATPTVAGGEGQTAGKPAATTRKKPAAAATTAAEPSKTKEDLAREAGVAPEQVAAATAAKPAAPAAESDDLSDLLGDAAPAARVISDKELGEICNKEAGRLKGKMGDKYDTKVIRTLVAKFAVIKEGEVPKIIAIPADKREAFVKELEAL